MEMDPTKLKPMPGRMVVEIIEVLGGMTKGGIFVPGDTQSHMGKDTCACKVLSRGDRPTLGYAREDGGWKQVELSRPWPDEYRQAISVGCVVIMPRDVELAFTWQDPTGWRRYAIVNEHEAILAMSEEVYLRGGFEVVPWTPGEIGIEATQVLQG